MKRRPDYFERAIKILIVILVIAVIAIAAYNMFGPSYTEISMLGVSVSVPDGSFSPDDKYNVYSSYIGENGDWTVTAINFNNYNLTDLTQNQFINEYNTNEFNDRLYGEKNTVDGIVIYKTDEKVVSYFKVDSIDFKVTGSQDTVVSIVKSIQDLNEGSTITFT